MARHKKENKPEDIKQNMVRERALKLPEVTDEMYMQCNSENREMVEEFFDTHPLLAKQTKKQYRSGTRQFLWWVHETISDKPLYKIKKRDFNRYLSFLINRGMSSSGINFKRSSVSTVCEYIQSTVSEEDDRYATFHNFTKTDIKIPKNYVYNKIPVSEEEYKILIDTLIDDENYMGACWVACAFNTGARRGGIRQFKTEVLEKPIKEGQEYVMSNMVREKGFSEDGKQVRYMIPLPALYYIRLWIEKRGYDHEYIFTTNVNGEIRQMSLQWANDFCTNVLSDILERRINPHLFKSSAVSYYLSQGLDLKFVSENIAQHNDISTTSKFYDLRTFEDEKNEMLGKVHFPKTKKADTN